MPIPTFKERYEEMRQTLVDDINTMRNNGMTYQMIGDKLGVTRGAINNFLKDNNRKKLPAGGSGTISVRDRVRI